jgi:hypothetical protein
MERHARDLGRDGVEAALDIGRSPFGRMPVAASMRAWASRQCRLWRSREVERDDVV